MGNAFSQGYAESCDDYDIARQIDVDTELDMYQLSWAESVSSGSSIGGRVTIKEDKFTVNFDRVRKSKDIPNKLRYLSLAYEDLQKIPVVELGDALLNQLQIIDLSNNHIRDVSQLAEFERLTTANLDHNLIHCLTAFPSLPQLQTLWLNHNRIQTLRPFIPSLALQCPNLKELSLMGNQVCPNYLNGGTETQNEIYRVQMIRHFPKLVFLDDSPVTPEERERASRISSKRSSFSGPSGDSATAQSSSFVSIDEGIEADVASCVY